MEISNTKIKKKPIIFIVPFSVDFKNMPQFRSFLAENLMKSTSMSTYKERKASFCWVTAFVVV